jgi:nitrate reductase NapE component
MKKFILTVVLLLPLTVYSAPLPNFRVTNEMIYQKLIQIEQRQAIFDERFKQIDRRFEDMNRRFEDMNKRFEDMNRRFEELREDMNKRFEQLYTFLWIITGIFTAIMVGAFGFAYWDRRTIIAEARKQTLEELERDTRPEKLKKLLNVAREFAKENEKFEKIMRKEGLL